MGLKFNNNTTLSDEITRKSVTDGENQYYISEYPDFVFNNSVKVKCKNLGEKFASVNSFFFDYLKGFNIPTSYMSVESPSSLRFQYSERLPFYIKILNVSDKRNSRILGLKELTPLNLPFFEIHYGFDKDNVINESHIISLDLCNIDELKTINRIASKTNAILNSFFARRNYLLAEVKCWFGKCDDKIFLIDDFTPKSIKVLPNDTTLKTPDPYKFGTSTEIKKYTEHLQNLMNT